MKIIDADSHVTEPPDLWTSRLGQRWSGLAPRVLAHPDNGKAVWRVGDEWLTPVGAYARAGWREFPPVAPSSLDEVDPGTWRAGARLERLNEYGIYAQTLHPNLLGMDAWAFLKLGADYATACVVAYNDFIREFASADPARLLPIAVLPFWDVDASVAEVRRAAGAGFRGVLFGNDYTAHGLPEPLDDHWHPVYAAAGESGLPVVVHVGFGERPGSRRQMPYDPRRYVRESTISLMGNASMIARVVTSGLCDRFPSLRFVSIESGIGYISYLLESLDWNWKVHGMHRTSPLLPSEYFRRQCFATWWFEEDTLRLLDSFPDNFMFQTDYPHQNGLAPGPVSPAELPSSHIARTMSNHPATTTTKVLQNNAAALYRVAIGLPDRENGPFSRS